MASKQENVNDWMALAKAFDKVEKELRVEHYVKVILRNNRTLQILYQYDIPREMLFAKNWVINWREARLLCKYPRDGIRRDCIFYDKKSGLEYGIGTLLSSLIHTKAKITMNENKLESYKESQKSNMFFDETSDEIILKLKSKILAYKKEVENLEDQIKTKVTEKRGNHSPTIL